MSEDNSKYRNEWYCHLELIIKTKLNCSLIKNVNSNEKILIDLINDYVILTKFAFKEIEVDDTKPNKYFEEANVGLDCWDVILENLIIFSLKFVERNKLSELINSTVSLKHNDLDESLFSDSYKERKRLEELDLKLESYIL